MESLNTEKIYFIPGDIVTVRHNIPNKPVMVIKSKETKALARDEKEHFKGMRCFWFNTQEELQEAIFNTKDLIHVK